MVQPDGTRRISKIDTYLNVAEAFAYRSTCLKRKYGAVIVKDDVVVSTGYMAPPEVIRTAAISAPAPGSNGIFIRGRATSSAGPSMRSRMRF